MSKPGAPTPFSGGAVESRRIWIRLFKWSPFLFDLSKSCRFLLWLAAGWPITSMVVWVPLWRLVLFVGFPMLIIYWVVVGSVEFIMAFKLRRYIPGLIGLGALSAIVVWAGRFGVFRFIFDSSVDVASVGRWGLMFTVGQVEQVSIPNTFLVALVATCVGVVEWVAPKRYHDHQLARFWTLWRFWCSFRRGFPGEYIDLATSTRSVQAQANALRRAFTPTERPPLEHPPMGFLPVGFDTENMLVIVAIGPPRGKTLEALAEILGPLAAGDFTGVHAASLGPCGPDRGDWARSDSWGRMGLLFGVPIDPTALDFDGEAFGSDGGDETAVSTTTAGAVAAPQSKAFDPTESGDFSTINLPDLDEPAGSTPDGPLSPDDFDGFFLDDE